MRDANHLCNKEGVKSGGSADKTAELSQMSADVVASHNILLPHTELGAANNAYNWTGGVHHCPIGAESW